MVKEWGSRGAYLSLGRNAWKEGGGRSGWIAATKHFAKCIAMGGPFSDYDGSCEVLKALCTVKTFDA
eukprot:4544438-Pyramimonas_sp.AAC.1